MTEQQEYFMLEIMIAIVSTILSTHERWSWEVSLLTVIRADRSGTAEISSQAAKAGTRELCGFLSAHQPGFVQLLAPSPHATRRRAPRWGRECRVHIRVSASVVTKSKISPNTNSVYEIYSVLFWKMSWLLIVLDISVSRTNINS